MDYNNDGYDDLLVGDSPGNNWLFQGKADGLARGIHIKANGTPIKLPNFGAPFLADMNNDGCLDFLFGGYTYSSKSGEIRLYMNQGSNPNALNFSNYTTLSFWNKFKSTQEAHDLDMDGDYDLVLASADGRVYFAENKGTASNPVFNGFISLRYGNGTIINAGTYSRVTVNDWNEDGVPDLIVGGLTGSSPTFYRKLQVYLGSSLSIGNEDNSDNSDKSSFYVSGSPTHDVFTMNFSLKKSANVSIAIINCSGRVVKNIERSLQMGNSTVICDISTNPPGLYMLTANFGNQQLSDKVILVR